RSTWHARTRCVVRRGAVGGQPARRRLRGTRADPCPQRRIGCMAAMESPIRVLLVDDQPLLRAGFRMILDGEPGIAVVGECSDGEAAVADARALQPDVVVMDIRMPRLDGVQATRAITGEARDQTPRVLVLTTFDLDEYIVEALRAGASGFLLKDAPAEDLVA